jgi:hypothetical protein
MCRKKGFVKPLAKVKKAYVSSATSQMEGGEMQTEKAAAKRIAKIRSEEQLLSFGLEKLDAATDV